MTNVIHVLIVDDISTTLDNLRKLLVFEEGIEVVGTASTGREAIAEAKRLHPDVVVMDINMPEMDGIQATEIMALETPRSPVIIMSAQGAPDYLRGAMLAGAREFLIKPFSGDELVASVFRVHQMELRKETYSRAGAAPPSLSGQTLVAAGATSASVDAPPEPVAAEGLPARAYGEQIVLYGGKGGVGTSVLATNLACALAKEAGARVALVDFDLQFGDVGVLLNLHQARSISDLVEAIDVIDSDFVGAVMSTGPAGVRVLPAATSPELADLVTPEHAQKILGLLRTMFDFVIIDTSSYLGDVTVMALEEASSVILVAAPSITSVKDAQLALRLMESLSVPVSAITLVLNQCEARVGFNMDSIESHLQFPITIQVPHDPRTVASSINRGTPFVVSNPEVEASQRVRQLAAHLLPEKLADATAHRSRGLRRGRR